MTAMTAMTVWKSAFDRGQSRCRHYVSRTRWSAINPVINHTIKLPSLLYETYESPGAITDDTDSSLRVWAYQMSDSKYDSAKILDSLTV